MTTPPRSLSAHVADGARVAEDVRIGDGAWVDHQVELGRRVTVGLGAKLFGSIVVDEDVTIDAEATIGSPAISRAQPSKTVIRARATIGKGAWVVPGVIVGHGAKVAPEAVVTSDVPPWTIVSGNPGLLTGMADAQGGELPGGARSIKVPGINHPTGNIAFLEESSGLPFIPRRYFTLTHVPPSVVRARHAHKSCAQYFNCLHGSVRLGLDDGRRRAEVLLSRPDEGLWVPGGVWVTVFGHTLETSLLVLASEPYAESDYLRDYDDFLRFRGL